MLELIDRQAVALASAISDTTDILQQIAGLQGIALAGVFEITISEAGQRTREGQGQAKIADELHPIVESILDALDAWLSVTTPPALRAGTAPRPCELWLLLSVRQLSRD